MTASTPLPRTRIALQQAVARQLPYLEFLFVCVIIMVCASMQFLVYKNPIARARLAEIPLVLSSQRAGIIEHFALFGTLPDDTLLGEERGAMPAEDAEKPTTVASAAALRQAMEPTTRVEGEKGLIVRDDGRTIYGISNGAPTAVLVRPFLERPVMFELRPAMAANDPAVMIWLCGRQAAPGGLTARPAREPAVPIDLSPPSCRSVL